MLQGYRFLKIFKGKVTDTDMMGAFANDGHASTPASVSCNDKYSKAEISCAGGAHALTDTLARTHARALTK